MKKKKLFKSVPEVDDMFKADKPTAMVKKAKIPAAPKKPKPIKKPKKMM